MRFSTLSLLATVASAAFSFAAPVSPASNQLEARCLCHDINSIIVEVSTTLNPILSELSCVTAETATVEHLTPIIGELTGALNVAITDVKGLVGLTEEVILTTAEGVVLTVAEVATLVVALLRAIFIALAVVLRCVTYENAAGVIALLCQVVELVAVLLKLILGLVDGLLVVVVRLLDVIILDVIVSLKLTATFSFIPVTWSSATTIVSATTSYITSTIVSAATYTAA
jgi:hypothetical protein